MSEDWQQDVALLDAWRDGDDRAGERLFDRHADAVARFFENKVRDGAEDLTQATFLRLIEVRERIRVGIAFRAFVIGIARNVLREHLREPGRGRQVDPEVDCMAELAPGPSTLIGAREEHRLLIEALRLFRIE
jgi:RNA polymerase sigma-70 factor (ECF subfamily)